MATIKEVADAAGVSTTTVSNVIHGKTKKVSPANIEKIQNLIREMGYVQKMGLRVLNKESSQLIAVVINSHKEYDDAILADPFYGKILGFIEEKIRSFGYYMMFYSASDIDDIFKMVMAWDVDGVIALTFTKRDCEKIHHMIGKPVVSIDAFGEAEQEPAVQNIGLDDESGGYLMTRYLLEKGYRRIYVCASKDHGVDHIRLEGARRAAAESGCQEGQLQFTALGPSRHTREQHYLQIVQKVPFKRRTAMFFLSDLFALEAISCLADHGIRIPEDVGIAGYDDITYSRLAVPKLTTIRQDVRQKAYLAVEELVRRIRQEGEPEFMDCRLPVALLPRQSV